MPDQNKRSPLSKLGQRIPQLKIDLRKRAWLGPGSLHAYPARS